MNVIKAIIICKSLDLLSHKHTLILKIVVNYTWQL